MYPRYTKPQFKIYSSSVRNHYQELGEFLKSNNLTLLKLYRAYVSWQWLNEFSELYKQDLINLSVDCEIEVKSGYDFYSPNQREQLIREILQNSQNLFETQYSKDIKTIQSIYNFHSMEARATVNSVNSVKKSKDKLIFSPYEVTPEVKDEMEKSIKTLLKKWATKKNTKNPDFLFVFYSIISRYEVVKNIVERKDLVDIEMINIYLALEACQWLADLANLIMKGFIRLIEIDAKKLFDGNTSVDKIFTMIRDSIKLCQKRLEDFCPEDTVSIRSICEMNTKEINTLVVSLYDKHQINHVHGLCSPFEVTDVEVAAKKKELTEWKQQARQEFPLLYKSMNKSDEATAGFRQIKRA